MVLLPMFCWISLLLGFHGYTGARSLWVWHTVRIRHLQSEDPRGMAGAWAAFPIVCFKHLCFRVLWVTDTPGTSDMSNRELYLFPCHVIGVSGYCRSSCFATLSRVCWYHSSPGARHPAQHLPHEGLWKCFLWTTDCGSDWMWHPVLYSMKVGNTHLCAHSHPLENPKNIWLFCRGENGVS